MSGDNATVFVGFGRRAELVVVERGGVTMYAMNGFEHDGCVPSVSSPLCRTRGEAMQQMRDFVESGRIYVFKTLSDWS